MSSTKDFYEQDYALWIKKSVAAIKNKEFANIDWVNLLTEIEEVGKNQQRALKSYTKRLIEHILKVQYWDSERERNIVHWQLEIENFREEITDILQDSPSLKNYLVQNYADWFKESVTKMKKRFAIPENKIVSLENILNKEY